MAESPRTAGSPAPRHAPPPGARRELQEWREFLTKHGQRLESCYNLLFALCHLEGPPPLRRRCDHRLASGTRVRPWIRAMPQWTPPPVGPPAGRIEAVASMTFPVATACALAPLAAAAYITERLGSLGRVDLRRGRRLDPPLDIRRERPLQLGCSDDGRFVAVAYESGDFDVMETGPFASSGGQARLAWSARFLVPEYEAPSISFSGADVWRQDETGDAVACDAASGEITRRSKRPQGCLDAELAGVAVAGDAAVLAWRRAGNLGVVLVADRGATQTAVNTDAKDAGAIVAWGPDAIAIAFSDRRLRIYSLQASLEVRHELALDAPGACLAARGPWLWCATTDGRLYRWKPPDEHAEPLLAPGLSLSRPRSIALNEDGEGVVLTPAIGISFCAGTDSRHGPAVQAAALMRGRSTALATQAMQWTVIDAAARRTWDLAGSRHSGRIGARPDRREVGYLFAADGGGKVLAAHDDVSELLDLATGDSVTCELPSGAVSAAGTPTGPFWIADVDGRIYSLDGHGVCREAAVVSSDIQAPPHVSAWESLVVWSGTRVATNAGSGADPVHLQVFFRPRGHALERLGTREYVAADGILRAVVWDGQRGRLITIWQGRAHGYAVAKVGSLQDVLAAREREHVLPSILAGCESAALSATGHRCFVLDTDGAVHCLDADTFAPVATLAGSLPFTALAEAIPVEDEVVAVMGRELVLVLRSEEQEVDRELQRVDGCG